MSNKAKNKLVAGLLSILILAGVATVFIAKSKKENIEPNTCKTIPRSQQKTSGNKRCSLHFIGGKE